MLKTSKQVSIPSRPSKTDKQGDEKDRITKKISKRNCYFPNENTLKP